MILKHLHKEPHKVSVLLSSFCGYFLYILGFVSTIIMIILNTELEQMVYFHAKRMLFLRLCLKKALKSTEGSIIHYRSSGLKVTILESLFAECFFFKQFIITTLLIYSGGGNGVIESE